MNTRILKCPFCDTQLSTTYVSHLKKCARKNNLIYKDAKIKFYFYNWPEFSTKENFERIYSTHSIPDFKKEYSLHDPLMLCDYYGIPHRTIQESNKHNGIGQQKIKKVVKEKYGVDNVLSKGSIFYEKRNETVKNKYNVTNVFQIEEIKRKIHSDELYLSRFGMTYKQYKSASMEKFWKNLSDDEKEEWLNKSIHKHTNSLLNLNHRSFNSSSLESKICNLLQKLPFSFVSQYKIKYNTRNFYSYDFYITDINTLIEVNGSYWHANPSIYKANDIIKYPGHTLLASEVWKKDAHKKQIAANNNKVLAIIWDTDLDNINTPEDLLSFIKSHI